MVTQIASIGGTPDYRRPFKTILADPPWDVQQKGALGAQAHYQLTRLLQ